MGLFKKDKHTEPVVQPASSTTATDGSAYGNTTIPGNEPYASHAPGSQTTEPHQKEGFLDKLTGKHHHNESASGAPGSHGTHGTHGTTAAPTAGAPGSYAATSGPTHHHSSSTSANADPRTTGQKVKDAFTPGDQGAQYRNEPQYSGDAQYRNDGNLPAGAAGYGHTTGTHSSHDPAHSHHSSTGVYPDNRTTGQKVKDAVTPDSRQRDYANDPNARSVHNDPYNQTGTGPVGSQHHHAGTGTGAGAGAVGAGHHDGGHTTSSSSGGGIFSRNKKDDDLEDVLRQEAQAKKDMEEAIARHNAAHTNAGTRLQSQEDAARREFEEAQRRLREAEEFRRQHGH